MLHSLVKHWLSIKHTHSRKLLEDTVHSAVEWKDRVDFRENLKIEILLSYSLLLPHYLVVVLHAHLPFPHQKVLGNLPYGPFLKLSSSIHFFRLKYVHQQLDLPCLWPPLFLSDFQLLLLFSFSGLFSIASHLPFPPSNLVISGTSLVAQQCQYIAGSTKDVLKGGKNKSWARGVSQTEPGYPVPGTLMCLFWGLLVHVFQ